MNIGLIATQLPVGSNFIARINIDSVTDFDAAQYDVTYDPAVIAVTGVTKGDIGGTEITATFDFIPTSTQGMIRVINNVDGAPGVSGSGYLAEIHFHAIGASGTSSVIDLHDGILNDKTATVIPSVTWTDGSINISGTLAADFSADKTKVLIGQSIAFTNSTSGGSGVYSTYAWDFDNNGSNDSAAANPDYSYTAPGTYAVKLTVTDSLGNTNTATAVVKIYKLGDANKDGRVSALDITYIENTIFEHSGYVYTTWADANKDKKINVLDITAAELIILQNP